MKNRLREPSARAWLAALLLVPAAAGDASAQTLALVSEGRPAPELRLQPAWRTVDGALVLTGSEQLLRAPLGLGSGDASVRVVLSLDAIDGTAASVVLDDSSHFGLDSRGSKFFLEGSRFGRGTRSLMPTADHITPGRPFELAITRKGGVLRFEIDGKLIHEQPEEAGTVFGSVALRPRRATMRVRSWVLEGELLADPYVPAEVERQTTVFRSGEDGYHTFRIPAIVRAANGDLLAFCEGRVNGGGDSGDIDLVLKRSEDGGRTWGPLQLVVDHGEGVAGNPAPVVERSTGHVVLVFVEQPSTAHESSIRAGSGGYRTPFVIRSEDHGRSWGEPRSIEETADRKEWRWYASGPCHAIQLEHGPHAGRLVVPANYSAAGDAGNRNLGAHAILSDDGGRSWRIGAVDDAHLGGEEMHPNESAVVELPDGRLLFNARDQHGKSPSNRLATVSTDGGESFRTPYREEAQLVAPVCQAALLGVPYDGGFVTLFSAPGDATRRRRMQLRFSLDGGGNWRGGPVIYRGDAAYSDLVLLPDARVGCLHEVDGYRRIVFAVVPVESILASQG